MYLDTNVLRYKRILIPTYYFVKDDNVLFIMKINDSMHIFDKMLIFIH